MCGMAEAELDWESATCSGAYQRRASLCAGQLLSQEGVVTPGQLRTTPAWPHQLPTYLLADISSHSPPIGLAGFDRSVSVCIHFPLGVLEL